MDSLAWKNISYLDMFLLFFPEMLREVIIEATNSNLRQANAPLLTHNEFLQFIGLWLFMATVCGSYSRRKFWDKRPVSMEYGAPYSFHEYMSRNRFEQIISNLGFTTWTPPAYTDKFWQVRQMIEIWNNHMTSIFSPGWVSCLDESMSIWFN